MVSRNGDEYIPTHDTTGSGLLVAHHSEASAISLVAVEQVFTTSVRHTNRQPALKGIAEMNSLDVTIEKHKRIKVEQQHHCSQLHGENAQYSRLLYTTNILGSSVFIILRVRDNFRVFNPFKF